MQLIFTVEEYKALINILRECASEVHAEEQSQNPVLPILENVLNRDLCFGFDQLEDLEGILSEYRAKVKRELDKPLRRDHREALLHRERLVGHMIEKVTESCAMV